DTVSDIYSDRRYSNQNRNYRDDVILRQLERENEELRNKFKEYEDEIKEREKNFIKQHQEHVQLQNDLKRLKDHLQNVEKKLKATEEEKQKLERNFKKYK